MLKLKNPIYHVLVVGIIISLKLYYKSSTPNDLKPLLNPTSTIVSFLTATNSTFLENKGYYYPQISVLIDKSCSGFNLLLICFAMLAFLVLNLVDKYKPILILSSFIIAYGFTIFANSSRIYASIVTQHFNFMNTPLAHETIGIATNVSFLILLYIIVEKSLTNLKKNEKFI